VRSILFDGLVSAGVVGLTSLGIFERETPAATMWLGYLMAAAVLFRRRWSMWSMAVISLAALMQVILFPPAYDPLPYDLAVLVGMYSVVKYAKPRIGPALAGATVATGIVIEVVRHPRQEPVSLGLFFVGVCGGVWLMAYTMRVRRLYVLGLEARAATLERERDHLARIAVADERAAIARELHDVVAHSLAVMIVQADGGRYAFEADPAQARAALDTVAATGREALEDMRRLVGVLRGSEPDAPGAPPSPDGAGPSLGGGAPPDGAARPSPDGAVDRRRVGLGQLPGLVDRATSAGLEVDLRVEGLAATLPQAVELAVFRLLQEALTNVIRHAGARARVDLHVRITTDGVSLSVVDDGGAGPLPPAGPLSAGHGLVGMRERVAVHGGTLDAGPRPERGWAVHASIPLTRLPAPTAVGVGSVGAVTAPADAGAPA
jgi:signal transduction histidine kinase